MALRLDASAAMRKGRINITSNTDLEPLERQAWRRCPGV
jgi:hypothetical protein